MRFQGRRAMITGGAGFIGSTLAHRLVAEGADVCVVDSLVPGLGGNLFNLEGIQEKVSFLRHDIRETERLVPFLRECDFIFNLAGSVSHVDSLANPAADHAINLHAQVQLLEACRAHHPKVKLIFASTRQVYGRAVSLPVDDSHPANPIDVNGINKLAAESYHRLYDRHYGLRTVCLRLTNTYGPRQLIRHSRQGFVGWFLNRVLQGEMIELFGGGEQLRDFNHVDDVVEAFLLAALNPTCEGEVFLLSGDRCSLAQVADLLVSAAGRGSVRGVRFPQAAHKIDIGDYYGCSARFRERTGWAPRIALAEGMRDTLGFYQKHLSHYL